MVPQDAPRAPPGGSLLRVLTHTQNASAAAFGLFMGIHLAAPIAAGFGGTSAADGVMLVGREYYLFLEPLAVYAPLGLHLTASLAKRAVLVYRTRRFHCTAHTVLGYVLLPLLIPHLILHRILPSTEGPPINELSPSEMGYEFAGYACATRKWMTAGYVVLTGVALWHGIVGGLKVLQWARGLWRRAEAVKDAGEKVLEKTAADTSKAHEKSDKKRRRRAHISQTEKLRAIRTLVTTTTTAVCVGLVRMTADAQGLSSFTASRYDAVFASAPWVAAGFR
ncbi:hypothetical protein CC85DRAFT_286644 [Cutaneotrichosporon oleaginosum]|uniref:Mitochondrial adapter protein MCP1 transmembrane domain-containing protein n=1 Tax=Cutaneotrichosporon oleaginosum TaxID=879819 RepID=A0A0J0XJF2_9TREE|nr:uncharacterized protein CC85DRAFT_286644 [Cutaneotrichosporon oleaginosum]KLT41208.1 hypothetical protein CC85DRAFT_286644 [Cutaneotrichosporon oleaginosum]TXT05474.1 hypothetical protein COLE_06794 [Cutaneotrichosporon oleaginosum]